MEEDLHRTKNTLQAGLKIERKKLKKLMNQLTNKTLSNSSQLELASRLHQLTETLIHKQTMLERLKQQVHFTITGPSSGSSINMSGVDSG